MSKVGVYDPKSSGGSGTFPSATTGPTSAAYIKLVNQDVGVEGFLYDPVFDISSSDQQYYLDSKGNLNANAAQLIAYAALGQSERQDVQDAMVTAGVLSPTDATGIVTSSSISAYKNLIGTAALQGMSVKNYLDTYATGTSGIQSQISQSLTKAQEAATQPIVATVENPTTLSADITAAFETALGYSPDQAQISSFISQVQGQDTAYAEAPRTEAQQQINMAHSEESALNKLGPDGIDSVIQAYQAAVNGTKLPGAGTVQGPANGQVASGAPNQFPTAGTQLPPGNAAYVNQGREVGVNTPPVSKTSTQLRPEGGVGGFLDNLANSAIGRNNGVAATKVTTTTARPGGIAPTLPPGANTTTTYGGLYALSGKDWAEAEKLIPTIIKKSYATPGSAPASVQQSALNALLQNAYEQNGGSWSKAVSSIASGTPFGTSEGSNLTAFGDQVASEVNNQITQLQSQVNNDTVTTKVSQPDAVAEADLAAKQSDPTGYYAAQDASWGSVLNKMLSGTPDMYDQSSSDTFTGPVASQAETSQATAPTTVGAGGV